MDYISVTVYLHEQDIQTVKDICKEVPNLSCMVDEGYPSGKVLEEDVYAVDLLFEK